MTIDSHQHFWQYHKEDYRWINEKMIFIKKDFTPEDLKKELNKLNIEGSIAVQARQTLEETRWLLNLAGENNFIRGVIGWVDLLSERVEEQLFEFTGQSKFIGVRHAIQDEPDIDFMVKKEFIRGMSYLQDYGLTYDLLVLPEHLKIAEKLVSQLPEQKFILDHMGKPFIRKKILEPWATDIKNLAENKNVYCKLSGMVTEADWTNWRPEDIYPFIDIIYQRFGPERIMIGSDWPVCLLAGSYEEVMKIVFDYIKGLPIEDQEKITGKNCESIYGLKHD